jgi:hypothetical protein
MIIDVLVWLVCISLLLLTIICQRPRWKPLQTLKYNDLAAFIPAWTFFAPNPGTTDTRILWREMLFGGSISPWHEVLPPNNGPLRPVWNPTKRQRKLITDVGPMVLCLAHTNPKSEYTLISLPYLIILHRVMSLPASPIVCARQFLVVQTTHEGAGEGEMHPLFASRWHALDVTIGSQADSRAYEATSLSVDLNPAQSMGGES